jgi:hypothetical protein
VKFDMVIVHKDMYKFCMNEFYCHLLALFPFYVDQWTVLCVLKNANIMMA